MYLCQYTFHCWYHIDITSSIYTDQNESISLDRLLFHYYSFHSIVDEVFFVLFDIRIRVSIHPSLTLHTRRSNLTYTISVGVWGRGDGHR